MFITNEYLFLEELLKKIAGIKEIDDLQQLENNIEDRLEQIYAYLTPRRKRDEDECDQKRLTRQLMQD